MYVVIGEAGEYSDYSMWFVCYYRDHKRAKQHAEWANRESDEFTRRYNSWREQWLKSARKQAGGERADYLEALEAFEKEHPAPSFAPDPDAWHWGATYSVGEIPEGWC